MNLTPGIRLGDYESIAAIGQGGMGEVLRAREATPGRERDGQRFVMVEHGWFQELAQRKPQAR